MSYNRDDACLHNICNNIHGYGLNLITITPIDSPYATKTDDDVILCDTTLGDITVELKRGNKYDHPVFTIKKSDTSVNDVIVVPGDPGDTI